MDNFFRCGPFSATAKDRRVLFENIEISLPDSVFVSLSGPSGCGKTTLLNMAAGLRQAPEATRQLCGQYFPDDRLPQWRSRVLLMMQDAPVLSGDVETNLRFPFSLANAGTRRFEPERARELMQQAGLGHIAMDRDVSQLSGGERHRLALVRAILWSPDVILADEPLVGLDRASADRALEMLMEFAKRPGRALLCVMHERSYTRAADIAFRLEVNGLVRES